MQSRLDHCFDLLRFKHLSDCLRTLPFVTSDSQGPIGLPVKVEMTVRQNTTWLCRMLMACDNALQLALRHQYFQKPRKCKDTNKNSILGANLLGVSSFSCTLMLLPQVSVWPNFQMFV